MQLLPREGKSVRWTPPATAVECPTSDSIHQPLEWRTSNKSWIALVLYDLESDKLIKASAKETVECIITYKHPKLDVPDALQPSEELVVYQQKTRPQKRGAPMYWQAPTFVQPGVVSIQFHLRPWSTTSNVYSAPLVYTVEVYNEEMQRKMAEAIIHAAEVAAQYRLEPLTHQERYASVC